MRTVIVRAQGHKKVCSEDGTEEQVEERRAKGRVEGGVTEVRGEREKLIENRNTRTRCTE